ncbi:hypothetical protein QFC22_006705 [Naganishia vaughanmartiniae]|uniref:Uncharacterized protein n=1 Tax=Naganishia vaughanmartiniae TaxID=1424756 RepID=A0ACC2WIE9_9TREE|nr:hypothetical protein QFC22_006705 [Naganishia vaughanmartiniae]
MRAMRVAPLIHARNYRHARGAQGDLSRCIPWPLLALPVPDSVKPKITHTSVPEALFPALDARYPSINVGCRKVGRTALVEVKAQREIPTTRTGGSWLSWITGWWRTPTDASQPTPPPPPSQPTTITPIPYSNHYLPHAQTTFLAVIRTANLRSHPRISSSPELAEIIKLVRLWRLGHTRKAVYYEDLALPERRPMTASAVVYGGVSASAAAAAEHGGGDGEEAGKEDGAQGEKVEQGEMIRRLEARSRARVEATR